MALYSQLPAHSVPVGRLGFAQRSTVDEPSTALPGKLTG
jgi:hypothetical protein